MSWWHRDHRDQYTIQEIIDWLNIYIWFNQPKSYEWLNKKYYTSLERRMKVPKRIKQILIEFKDIIHEIDYDVSWDSTIKKWYFDKKKKKILSLLQ